MTDAQSPAEWFPVGVEEAYMASVRNPHGASLLVDTGSPNNLCGDAWSREMANESQRIDRFPHYSKRDRTMTCKGIGTGSQPIDWDVEHAISLGNGRVDTYTAPELPDSNTPGILGRHSLRRRRTLIDTFSNVLYMVGPGGYELRLSPGSEKYDCVDSSMGHMMLPCSNFNNQSHQSKESMHSLVGEYFTSDKAATQTSTPKGVAGESRANNDA